MKQPIGLAFVGMAVRLVVWTSSFLCTPARMDILQVEQKNNDKNKQRVEERNRKTRIQNCKRQEGEILHFKAFLCVFMAIARTQRKSDSAIEDTDSSGHCLHNSVSSFLTDRLSILTSTLCSMSRA